LVLWDQPVTGNRYTAYVRGVGPETFLPRRKVDSPRIRSQHDELREGKLRPIRDVDGRPERGRPIAWESEDEATQELHAMAAERAEARDQRIANVVEPALPV
jgi:hypothetical protein